MNHKYFDRLWVVFIVFCLILGGFMGCKNKKSVIRPLVHKRKEVKEVFQRIKVTNTDGVTLEVNNPEIDYSEDNNTPDDEFFGIRIKKKDGTETIPWDEINHIDIAINSKSSLTARVKLVKGNMLDVDLVEDSKGGLSGTTVSGMFQLRLRKVKTIDVIRG